MSRSTEPGGLHVRFSRDHLRRSTWCTLTIQGSDQDWRRLGAKKGKPWLAEDFSAIVQESLTKMQAEQ